MLSSIFGQGRSDYVTFLGAGVPSVFFTDATGPCYHTAQDEIGIVDFGKLDQQIATALDVTRQLAQTSTPPVYAFGHPPGHPEFIFPGPLATYADAVAISSAVQARSWTWAASPRPTRRRCSASRDELARIVADGPAAFGPEDVGHGHRGRRDAGPQHPAQGTVQRLPRAVTSRATLARMHYGGSARWRYGPARRTPQDPAPCMEGGPAREARDLSAQQGKIADQTTEPSPRPPPLWSARSVR